MQEIEIVIFILAAFVLPAFGADKANKNEKLVDAAFNGDYKTVEALLKAGADVNAKIPVEKWGTKGWSAVMFAEFLGNTKTVSILRKAGAADKLTQAQRKQYTDFLQKK